MRYLDDFSPTIVLFTVSTIALLDLRSQGPSAETNVYNSCNGRSKKLNFYIYPWVGAESEKVTGNMIYVFV